MVYRLNDPQIRICYLDSDLKEAREFLHESVLITNDIETNPKERKLTVNGYCGTLNNGETRSYVFPLYKSKDLNAGLVDNFEQTYKVMQEINDSGIPMVMHNGIYDNYYSMVYGIPVKNWAHDTMIMWWSMYPELPKDLAFVSSIVLDDHQYWKGDRKSDSWHSFLLYNGKDIDRTQRIAWKLIDGFSEDSVFADRARRNYVDAMRRVVIGFQMSMRGFRWDKPTLDKHAVTLRAEAAAALERVRFMLNDPDFNPNSPAQMKRLIYQLLGARLRNARGRFVSKLEDASTGQTVLRAIRSEHPIYRKIIDAIIDVKTPAKQISNVINCEMHPSGRFHTAYNGAGTTTTRYSASATPLNYGMNGQNLRKGYRDIIQPDDDDCFILDYDFSAADDVFVSFESGDPRKIELFRSGKDSHSQNATLFFPHWTYDQVVSGKKANDDRVVHPITGIRQITKKMSHGCNYLMAALTLLMNAGTEAIVGAAKELGYEDAGWWNQEKLAHFCTTRELLYREYYTRFKRSGVGSWYMDLRDIHKSTGGYTTAFGYYQRFLGHPDDDAVLRAIAATAGQASTAGRINMAMDELTFGYVRPEFRDGPNPDYGKEPLRVDPREFGISLRLQTHDSLTWNVNRKNSAWKEGVQRILTVLQRPVVILNTQTGMLEEFSVGIEGEAGLAWGKGMQGIRANTLESVVETVDSLPW